MENKRTEKRDSGEHDQNVAAALGLTDVPQTEEVVHPGKCPTCGRDKINDK